VNWMPVWMGADSSEYSAWALLFIIIWGGAGAIAAALLLLVCGAIKRATTKVRRNEDSQPRSGPPF
jgi:hypothetical protein